jgi:uncharacterized radical SAM superfamily Fe-S cluster-containing enzyme
VREGVINKDIRSKFDELASGRNQGADFGRKRSGDYAQNLPDARRICGRDGDRREVSERIESLFYGRDFKAAEDKHVHHHGTSDIKFGRGAVLTVDLTNRCNMMCNPCFMDANQVGYVHEPTFEDTKAILDNAPFRSNRAAKSSFYFRAASRRFRRTFLESVAYAKKIGFYRILAATNGIRYAEDIEFCKAAKAAGQHGVYLQFDGERREKQTSRRRQSVRREIKSD